MTARLKALRIKRGLTQEGMAQIFNVSQQSISRMEAGETEIPIDVLCKAAKYFQVSADYLLGLTEERSYVPSVRKDIYLAKQYESFLLCYHYLEEEHRAVVEQSVHRLSQIQKQFE